jgi:hypothetical protein
MLQAHAWNLREVLASYTSETMDTTMKYWTPQRVQFLSLCVFLLRTLGVSVLLDIMVSKDLDWKEEGSKFTEWLHDVG